MATRLWEKGEGVNQAVHAFTVGNDPEIDMALVHSDILGSAAHTRMLSKVGLLSKDDAERIRHALSGLLEKVKKGAFSIPLELEDCHTAIESFLIEELGEAGKRVHTGRSRNDQVLLAMRLYLREQVLVLLDELSEFVDIALTRGEEYLTTPMPGYTHLQPAMPSSIGMWLEAFAENALELMREGHLLLELMNSNPLGAGAGFGVSLPLDREETARLLGFARVQRNPIDAQNSRGRYELRVLRWCSDISSMIEKLAWDMQLYFMNEFRFISLPRELTTGSSIMPQKHNPDVLELLRGKAGKMRGAENELAWIVAKLPSNYHRDLQYTKEPVVRTLRQMPEYVRIAAFVVKSFTVNLSEIEKAMVPELYATYEAFRQVESGKPFRDAYRETAKLVEENNLDVKTLKGDLAKILSALASSLEVSRRELGEYSNRVARERQRLDVIEWELLSEPLK